MQVGGSFFFSCERVGCVLGGSIFFGCARRSGFGGFLLGARVG